MSGASVFVRVWLGSREKRKKSGDGRNSCVRSFGIKREQKIGWKLEEHLEMRVWLFQMFEC